MVVPKFVAERRFRGALLRDGKLFGGQFLFQFRGGWVS